MLELELPWPSYKLGPNGNKGGHWGVKTKAKNIYGEHCFWLAKQKMLPDIEGNIPITIIFNPPTKTYPDLDNALSRMKSGLDFIAKAWGVNDKRFRPITIDFGDVVKHGSVLIRL